MISPLNKELSLREINRAKRKARQAVHKQRSRENVLDDNSSEEPERKKPKTEVKEEYAIQFGEF